jgi:hypothetical protein
MKAISKLLAQYEKEMVIVCERKRCTRQASHIVTWHVMDECKAVAMPPTGNRIYLLCAPCAKDTVDRYREKLNRVKDALLQRDSAVPLECTTCGKRVNRLSDVCKMERLIYRLNVKSVGGQPNA